MSTYAIGDVQGCYIELRRLLQLIEFDRDTDCLWFVGDLVNRGPQSLEVLRLVKSLGDAARVVLGNHDLHLLAASQGVRKLKTRDTFHDVLDAPDASTLLDWLRQQPLLHHDPALGFTMVHAGMVPQWSVEFAVELAAEVSSVVRSDRWVDYFEHMYGDTPSRWSAKLKGWDRTRFITNALTRVRYCTPDGDLAVHVKDAKVAAKRGLQPWFAVPGRRSADNRIVFGHWAMLQRQTSVDPVHGVYHVDHGCVWGGSLAALRLEDLRLYSVAAEPGSASDRR